MSYLNFAVEVAALPNNQYRISVQSPVGEASVDVDSPFTPDDIQNILAVLGNEANVSREERQRVAREFGNRLFNFLFRSSNDISNAYFASLREVGNADGLRLRLTVDRAGILSQLPWEYLRDPSIDFLALSRRTPIVRYTAQLDTRPPAAIKLPLRVLVMISSPDGLPPLDIEGEWQRLQEATAPLQARGMIALERLDTATLIALQHRLRTEEYHVFHYIGHSDYDPKTQQGIIVFEDEQDNSRPQVITANELSRELAEESTVRLVVLNSCHSARRPSADVFAGISSSLVARGIPAVVAMQFMISDAAAKAFADEFYRAIAEMLPLDAALSEARRAIANRIRNTEWATPVLYMRAENGVLFRFASGSNAEPTTPSQRAVQRGLFRRLTNSQLVLLGGVALLILAALVFGISQFIFPPLPTPTPVPALLPDLTVGRTRFSPPNPAPGEVIIVSITVSNIGQADSGAFDWAWDASLSNPVLLNSQIGRIDNIPPGASKSISFPFTYGWWQTFSSLLNVDLKAEVQESDEFNNRGPADLIMSAQQPFDIDFSLLPPNIPVEPPMTLDDDSFTLWNLDFVPVAEAQPDCADAPLMLIERGNRIAMTITGDNPTCTTLPLSIRIDREDNAAVSSAAVELLPLSNGTATLTYYADVAGTQAIYTSAPIDVQSGQRITLSANDGVSRQIRRVDVNIPGQTVQLTHLTLMPINP